jgi:5-methylcytosine-specific restriction endonuclease McrA
VPGALPILTRSARIAGRTARRTPERTSFPSGAVADLYNRARRRRKAPYSRAEVFARWGGQCCYCDAPAEHLDHVVPLSRGGRDVLSNVVPACAACNLAKAALTLAEWLSATEPLDHDHTDQH